MMRRSVMVPVTLCFAAMVAVSAWAGEFYEPEGVAIRGYDAVAYFTEHRPVKGSSRFTVFYLGSLFHFASAEHRDAFLKEPQRYVPQYGGFCAYGTAKAAVIEPPVASIGSMTSATSTGSLSGSLL